MSKIYGFGNALIDIEISISEEQLSSLGIIKGSMIHISRNQKIKWLLDFKDNILSKEPGGSIANSLHAASQSGSECFFSCSLGSDKEAKEFSEGFKNSNTKIFSNISKEDTGICFIFVTSDGERTMASNLAANKKLVPECLNKEMISNSDWLIFDAFSVCTKSGFRTAKRALEIAKTNNIKIGFGLADINLIESNLNEIKWVIDQKIDLLTGNKSEISLLNKYVKIESNTLCSLGSGGSTYNTKTVSAPLVKVVNTNGAGDALLGTFISLIKNKGEQIALEEAVRYASKVCTKGGPRL